MGKKQQGLMIEGFWEISKFNYVFMKSFIQT